MRTAGKGSKHTYGVFGTRRFAKRNSVNRDQRIRSKYESSRMQYTCSGSLAGGKNRYCFSGRKVAGFINVGRNSKKRDPGNFEQFAPSGRTRRKDQCLHKKPPCGE
jgi:hypothetical protein